MNESLYTSVQYLKGIGPKKAKALQKVGIRTIEDLLYYFPRRYEDRTNLLPIASLKEHQTYTIKAKVLVKSQRQSLKRRGFNILEVVVGDDTGKIFCVWFNQPYLKDYFKIGQTLILYGKIERYAGRLQMNSPEFEIISEESDTKPQTGSQESLHTGRLVSVYTLPEGITQRSFRQIIKNTLDTYLSQLNDFLPYDIRAKNNLFNLAKSLINIHFPQSLEFQKEAYRRLSFEEFFIFQLPLALRKLRKKDRPGIAHQIEGELVEDFIANLPFQLTQAQKRVFGEIKSDMARPQPMQRLLQGDVSSGKTVVATLASLVAIQGGYQAVFMVPTEILARQHYEKINSQSRGKISIGLLTSSLSEKAKKMIYQETKEGRLQLVIGTHALLEKAVKFKNLGLVVIDEQHKFGVGQRALLPQKGNNPDVLIMTATPIPRTLAITLYGDLDISVIDELPYGRRPIKTLHFSFKQRQKAYEIVREQLKKGFQAYVIYPVIEESYDLDMMGLKSVYEELGQSELRGFNLGLIHGRLRQREQDEIMLRFKNKEIQCLVSTTVLEVGIDVPETTCMVIEYAERFGLSQLHQLRGRVGRAGFESYCILISDVLTPEARARIEAMLNYHDGFRIAEEDLRIRGPGEFFGSRQHGLSELKIANPLTQLQLLKKAKEEATRLVRFDPNLEMRQNVLLKEKLLQRFPEYERLIVVG
ncbi:MAG: ATP-dependent DNA helicase RecG [Candidatus Omnitrophica bacterium]|nr:ATP-dependent DNA helicase RecG [Candidatus Omnitrophota bacterium]